MANFTIFHPYNKPLTLSVLGTRRAGAPDPSNFPRHLQSGGFRNIYFATTELNFTIPPFWELELERIMHDSAKTAPKNIHATRVSSILKIVKHGA